MKRVFVLTAALLVALLTLGARVATAFSSGVVNLAWNECWGPTLVTFACNTDAGAPFQLVGSYTSNVDFDSLNGNQFVIDMQTSGANLSPWWQVKNWTDGTVACRGGASPAASLSFDFTGGTSPCFDYWGGQASGGIGILRNHGGNNRQRILGVCTRSPSSAGPLYAFQETYSFKLMVSRAKTVGTDACTGCTDGVLLILNSINCTQNLGSRVGDKKMETLGTFASFQNVLPGAPGPTPTKNTTWGAVKSLYR